jgi:hypothetical protein
VRNDGGVVFARAKNIVPSLKLDQSIPFEHTQYVRKLDYALVSSLERDPLLKEGTMAA